jgi:hypothetical protein
MRIFLRAMFFILLLAPIVFFYELYSFTNVENDRLTENRETAITQIHKNQLIIEQSAKMVNIDPRLLGAAVYTERTLNCIPIIEDWGALVGAISVGFCQVNLHAFKEHLKCLLSVSENDKTYQVWGGKTFFQNTKKYFMEENQVNDWQLKGKLLWNIEFNIASAALILKQSMIRYQYSDNGFDISQRPDIAGTLYHSTFPKHITGQPDLFGLYCKEIYQDSLFMPQYLPYQLKNHNLQYNSKK